MTEQEQIKEMARAMCEHFDVSMKNQPCTKCRTYNKNCYTIHKAEVLYNKGYRKINDNGAVITKDELKQYQTQAVKEFAEKLKTKLFEFFQDNEELDGKISVGPLYVDIIGIEAEDGTIISLGLINELLKEYEEKL